MIRLLRQASSTKFQVSAPDLRHSWMEESDDTAGLIEQDGEGISGREVMQASSWASAGSGVWTVHDSTDAC